MSMALVMSEMPDLVRRVMAEHVPDAAGRCGGCRDTAGRTASWPCQTYRVAQEAEWVGRGNLPGTGPHGPVVPGAARPRSERPERSERSRWRAEAPYSYDAPLTGDTPAVAGTGGRRRRREGDAIPFPTTGGHARHAAL
ncbi:hypothetical protein [Actinomycetospora sp. NBRC 106378]|jgi:hypothetical protein|uniref:hypothetical protein n=1 Tax=Actinomycetospora sp. NBRC 106378 TaxID=3032208 RepID=UPI0024A4C031|nr:hypothetical protein [Actinomycetospora sp. NBRC 106378]GLZ51103.1 hypothetical protein Acsp07_07200 [Actinomycetospora sp. NBRC 106378]